MPASRLAELPHPPLLVLFDYRFRGTTVSSTREGCSGPWCTTFRAATPSLSS